MTSFLQLITSRVTSGAALIAAGCVVVAFTFTQMPIESRKGATNVSPPTINMAQSKQGQSSFDPMTDGIRQNHGGYDSSYHDADYSRPVDGPATGSVPPKKNKSNPVVKFISSDMSPITQSLATAERGSLMKSAIKVMHLLGIILGLGAATVLDLVIVKFLVTGEIKSDQISIVRFVTGIVSVGLAILWLSGILYLAHYAAFDPNKLWNQKVWAKIAIVGVLTINGYFIHHIVLPLMERQVGRALFTGLSRKQCALMLVFGTVSATSWYVPLVLGAMPHFNFVVPAPGLLVGYAIVLAMAIGATQGMVSAIQRGGARPQGRLEAAA
jgi:hypothetical protein